MKTLPEILDDAEMAETYPNSNELSFGEVGLQTLYDWAQQMKGTGWECHDCDIESVMQTFERWWKYATKRAYPIACDPTPQSPPPERRNRLPPP